MNRDAKGRFTRKATIVDETIEQERMAAFEELFEELAGKYPVAGFIVNLAVSTLGLMAAYHVAIALFIGTILYTGSLFFAFLLAMLAAVIGAIQALRLGVKVAWYVASGRFETDYQNAKNWLTGKFRRNQTGHKIYAAAVH